MKHSFFDTDYPLTAQQIADYRRDGFIQLYDLVTGEHLEQLRAAVLSEVASADTGTKGPQIWKVVPLNLWQRNPVVRQYSLSRRFANIAARLCGYRMRIWIDQALFKEPRSTARTPWHQDATYWPHREREHQLSLWIALEDATFQNGCMAFVPGTQHIHNLPRIWLGNPQNIFDMAPQAKHIKGRTFELKAGSCTFHNGLTFHYAGPNRTDGVREAFTVAYMPDGTTFTGEKTNAISSTALKASDPLDGELFPLVSDPDQFAGLQKVVEATA